MSETFEILHQPSLWDTSSATSSPESAGGSSPASGQDGTGRSGPHPAHASLSARQAEAQGLVMSDTSLPRSAGSLSSAVLQSSLESRLRGELGSSGSTLYSLGWSRLATPARRPILQRQALGDHIFASVCTGWPTPTKQDNAQEAGQYATNGTTLAGAVRQAHRGGWATPRVSDTAGPGLHGTGGQDLRTMAGWATPSKSDSVGATGGGQGSSLRTDAAGTRSNGSDASTPGTDARSGRPVEPGLVPLAHGVPARVVRISGYGDAIVPQLAAAFLRSVAGALR